MNNQYEWINNIEHLAVKDTLEKFGEEEIYTLTMGDFLRMPEVDFKSISITDIDVWVLLN